MKWMLPIMHRPLWASITVNSGRAALVGGLLAASLGAVPACATEYAIARIESYPAEIAPPSRRASFGQAFPSTAARQVADWVVHSADNLALPFAIVDKSKAEVHVFDANGKLIGNAPVLLGLAIGDDSAPGIGNRKLSTIRPEERTTPAGRFVVSLGENLDGQEILWVDYEAAISLHRVITSNAKERRAQRLDSLKLQDRRISYGCINVALDFYARVVSPTFARTGGIVYILPETRPLQEVFLSYRAE